MIFVIAPSVREGRRYLSQIPRSHSRGYLVRTGPAALMSREPGVRVVVLGTVRDYGYERWDRLTEVLIDRSAVVQFDSLARVLKPAQSVGSVPYSEPPQWSDPRQPWAGAGGFERE